MHAYIHTCIRTYIHSNIYTNLLTVLILYTSILLFLFYSCALSINPFFFSFLPSLSSPFPLSYFVRILSQHTCFDTVCRWSNGTCFFGPSKVCSVSRVFDKKDV